MRHTIVILWAIVATSLPTSTHQTEQSAALLVEANSEFTIRSLNSVDIQVCVSSVILADERPGVQKAISAELQLLLDSSAVYYTRIYTTDKGTACFLYVFQASSPAAAKNAIPALLGTSGVPYNGFTVECTIAAVPWRGEGDGPLGPDIPWRWTGADVILWGSSTAAVLVFCVVGVCCFVNISNSKEQRKVDEMLRSDKRLVEDFIDTLEKSHRLQKQKLAKASAKAFAKASAKASVDEKT